MGDASEVSVRFALNNVQLSTSDSPGCTHAKQLSEESARKASELLTANHVSYHTRFNGGFHNHITHHILALWALGASPDEMQEMYEYNKAYQAPIQGQHHETVLKHIDLKEPAVFDACLGRDECYANFLDYFKDEIGEKGVPAVIKEYVLQGDERADDIFCRMYTDLVHPMISLGCAIEFNQPSLVAEALAAACVHDNWPKDFLLPIEEHCRSSPEVESQPLLHVLRSLHHDPVMALAVRDTDPFNKIRDGLLKRVGAKEFMPHLSQFRVKPTPEDLQAKLEDMMYTSAYALGAAQRPGKRETLDFVLLHNVTLAVFYPAILAQDWLSDQDKARLLEAKARVDAVMFAACGSPALYSTRIVNYMPRHAQDGWEELFHRSNIYPDEGHIAKVVRALFSLDQLSETRPGFPIRKKEFVKIAHMAVDSAERALEVGGSKMPEKVKEAMARGVGQGGEMVVANQMRFVFYGGLGNAWQWIPELDLDIGGLSLKE